MSRDLPRNDIPLLILAVLAEGGRHGYAIAREIEQRSENALALREGSLYPALQRLQRKGWITAAWCTSEKNQRARYYELTEAGRKQLKIEEANWERLSAAISRVLQRT